MRVAIVGGPGIGKSTLVRQLGDLYHNGSYGEGEKGVWDPRVLEDIAEGRNPVGVTGVEGLVVRADVVEQSSHFSVRAGAFVGRSRYLRRIT